MVNSNGNELTWTQTDNPFDHTDGSVNRKNQGTRVV